MATDAGELWAARIYPSGDPGGVEIRLTISASLTGGGEGKSDPGAGDNPVSISGSAVVGGTVAGGVTGPVAAGSQGAVTDLPGGWVLLTRREYDRLRGQADRLSAMGKGKS
jgi:hypothetical protein